MSKRRINKNLEYWECAKQPFVCLIFLTPLLLFYEVGILFYGNGSESVIRNGADHWIRTYLEQISQGSSVYLPAFIVTGLVIWQVAGKFSWKITPDTLLGMFAESLLFAFMLILLAQLQGYAFQQLQTHGIIASIGTSTTQIISFLGAGIYEEFLFRLLLLPLCYGVFRLARLNHFWAAALAIISSSCTFSIAHYVGVTSDNFEVFSFLFRTLAGCFFSLLFVLRGFGITVGCHATYDVIVGVMMYTQNP